MQGKKARFAQLAAANVGFCPVSRFVKFVLTPTSSYKKMKRIIKRGIAVVLSASLFVASISSVSFGQEEKVPGEICAEEEMLPIIAEEGTLNPAQKEDIADTEILEGSETELAGAGELQELPLKGTDEVDPAIREAALKRAEELADLYIQRMSQSAYEIEAVIPIPEGPVNEDPPQSALMSALTGCGKMMGSGLFGWAISFGLNKLMDCFMGDPVKEEVQLVHQKVDEVSSKLDSVKTMISQLAGRIDEMIQKQDKMGKDIERLLKQGTYTQLRESLEKMGEGNTKAIRSVQLALREIDKELDEKKITAEQAEAERLSLLLNSFGMDVNDPGTYANITSFIDIYAENMSNVLSGPYSVMDEQGQVMNELSIFNVYYEILRRDPKYPTENDALKALSDFYNEVIAEYIMTTYIAGLSLNARIQLIDEYNKSGKGRYISPRAVQQAKQVMKERHDRLITEDCELFLDSFEPELYLYFWNPGQELLVSKKFERSCGVEGNSYNTYKNYDTFKAGVKGIVWGNAPTDFPYKRVKPGSDTDHLAPTNASGASYWKGYWTGEKTGKEFITLTDFTRILEYGRNLYPGESDRFVIQKLGFDMPFSWSQQARLAFKPDASNPIIYEITGGTYSVVQATEWYYDGSGRGSEPLGFHQVGLKYYYEDGSQWRESSFASGYRDLYGIVPLSVKPGTSQNEPEDPEPVRPSGVTGYMDNAVIFTGTPDNPLKTGTWNYDAASDCWYYTAGQILKNTWAYIMNPYAASGQHPSDWFWFDASGRMLAGWQFINGKWYYLNPQRDGTYGACFIGPGKTPDGWEIDAAGAWIGK